MARTESELRGALAVSRRDLEAIVRRAGRDTEKWTPADTRAFDKAHAEELRAGAELAQTDTAATDAARRVDTARSAAQRIGRQLAALRTEAEAAESTVDTLELRHGSESLLRRRGGLADVEAFDRAHPRHRRGVADQMSAMRDGLCESEVDARVLRIVNASAEPLTSVEVDDRMRHTYSDPVSQERVRHALKALAVVGAIQRFVPILGGRPIVVWQAVGLPDPAGPPPELPASRVREALLQNGPQTKRAIAASLGVSHNQVGRALYELLQAGEAHSEGGVWTDGSMTGETAEAQSPAAPSPRAS
jgi:predicted ArsR family transcriptional regulator